MAFIVDNIKWIMLGSGVLTLTMLFAAFAPVSAVKSNFGETLEGDAATLITRNWGALIALVGGMLIYGAFFPESRTLALLAAGLSKLVFLGLVLAHGKRYLKFQAGVAVVADSIMVVLYALYFASAGFAGPNVASTTIQ